MHGHDNTKFTSIFIEFFMPVSRNLQFSFNLPVSIYFLNAGACENLCVIAEFS